MRTFAAIVLLSGSLLMAYASAAFAQNSGIGYSFSSTQNGSDPCLQYDINGSASACLACDSGYTLQNGICIQNAGSPYSCPSGQTYSSTGNNGSGGCVPLPANTNSGFIQCSSGQFASYPYGGGNPTCVTQCPSGFTGDSSSHLCMQTSASQQSAGSNSTPTNAPAPSGTGLSCKGGTCTYVPLEPLPGLPAQFGGNDGSFYTYLNGLVILLIIIGAMLAVARFSIGGIIFMTSDIAGNRAKAKSQMWACVCGLLLLISSVLILKTVNPDLVRFNLSDLQKLATGSGYFQVAPTQGQ